MKKKEGPTKTSAGRPPQSEAAKERVRRHLAGEPPPPLDPAEAAGAPLISQSDRARARFAQLKQEKEAREAKEPRPQPKRPRGRPPKSPRPR